MDSCLVVTSSSENETNCLATMFASCVSPGAIVGLVGELGAGKTAFVRGIAQALGMEDDVSSPTFVLENIYSREHSNSVNNFITTVFHWDFYRTTKFITADELFENKSLHNGITLIEWPEKAEWALSLLDIRIDILIKDLTCSSGELWTDGGVRVFSFTDCSESGQFNEEFSKKLQNTGLVVGDIPKKCEK